MTATDPRPARGQSISNLVAVETRPQAADRRLLRAHVIPAASGDPAGLGLARCGCPAQYLTVVRDLDWAEVPDDLRCPHCRTAEPDPISLER